MVMAVVVHGRLRPAVIDWSVVLPPPFGQEPGASGLNTIGIVKPAAVQIAVTFSALTLWKFGIVHIGVGVGVGDADGDGVALGVAEGEEVGESEGVADGDGDGVGDGVGDGLGDGVGVGRFRMTPLREG